MTSPLHSWQFLSMVVLMLATLSALAQSPPASEQLLEAARTQLSSRNLDSAATLLRLVAAAPERAVPDRVQAWVLLGIVDFYRSGDSASASAFRSALALDPQLEVEALEEYDPALARLLAAERAALTGTVAASRDTAPAPPADSPVSPPAPVSDTVYNCLGKCPDEVVPPHFTFFPQLEIADASVGVHQRRLRTFLTFHAVVNADGVIEPETLIAVGGTARGTENELRRGLMQARFAPGRAGGARVRTRVAVRFDFQAEGTGWVRYSYRVVAR